MRRAQIKCNATNVLCPTFAYCLRHMCHCKNCCTLPMAVCTNTRGYSQNSAFTTSQLTLAPNEGSTLPPPPPPTTPNRLIRVNNSNNSSNGGNYTNGTHANFGSNTTYANLTMDTRHLNKDGTWNARGLAMHLRNCRTEYARNPTFSTRRSIINSLSTLSLRRVSGLTSHEILLCFLVLSQIHIDASFPLLQEAITWVTVHASLLSVEGLIQVFYALYKIRYETLDEIITTVHDCLPPHVSTLPLSIHVMLFASTLWALGNAPFDSTLIALYTTSHEKISQNLSERIRLPDLITLAEAIDLAMSRIPAHLLANLSDNELEWNSIIAEIWSKLENTASLSSLTSSELITLASVCVLPPLQNEQKEIFTNNDNDKDDTNTNNELVGDNDTCNSNVKNADNITTTSSSSSSFSEVTNQERSTCTKLAITASITKAKLKVQQNVLAELHKRLNGLVRSNHRNYQGNYINNNNNNTASNEVMTTGSTWEAEALFTESDEGLFRLMELFVEKYGASLPDLVQQQQQEEETMSSNSDDDDNNTTKENVEGSKESKDLHEHLAKERNNLYNLVLKRTKLFLQENANSVEGVIFASKLITLYLHSPTHLHETSETKENTLHTTASASAASETTRNDNDKINNNTSTSLLSETMPEFRNITSKVPAFILDYVINVIKENKLILPAVVVHEVLENFRHDSQLESYAHTLAKDYFANLSARHTQRKQAKEKNSSSNNNNNLSKVQQLPIVPFELSPLLIPGMANAHIIDELIVIVQECLENWSVVQILSFLEYVANLQNATSLIILRKAGNVLVKYMERASGMQLAMIMRCYGKSSVRNDALCEAVVLRYKTLLQDLTLQQISDILSGLASMEYNNSKPFIDAIPVIKKKFKVESIAGGRYENVILHKNDVNNNISSNATNNCTTSSSSNSSNSNDSNIKDKAKANSKQYITSPSILMTLLVAYSKEIIWNFELYDVLAEQLANVTDDLTLQELVAGQVALLRMDVHHSLYTAAFAQRLKSQLSDKKTLSPNIRNAPVVSAGENTDENSIVSHDGIRGISDGNKITESTHSHTSKCKSESTKQEMNLCPEEVQPKSEIETSHAISSHEAMCYLSALSRTSYRDRDLFNALISCIDVATSSLHVNEVAETLLSLARVGLTDSDLFRQLALCTVGLIPTANPLALSHIVRAYALAHHHDEELFSIVAERVIALKETMTAEIIASILVSFAEVNAEHDKLFLEMIPRVRLLAIYGSPSDLVNVVRAYAMINIWHYQLFIKLADRAVQIRSEFKGSQIVLLLDAYARVGMRYQRLFSDFAPAVATMAHTLSLPEVILIFKIYANVEMGNTYAFNACSQRVVQLMNECNEDEAEELICHLNCLGWEHNELNDALRDKFPELCDKLMQRSSDNNATKNKDVDVDQHDDSDSNHSISNTDATSQMSEHNQNSDTADNESNESDSNQESKHSKSVVNDVV